VLNKKKILIIDDDVLHLEIAAEMLHGEQFEVIAHNDGSSVLDRVKTIQPDLVLLDINMPGVSGDGLAVLFRADAEISHIPLVFYSSYDEESLRKLVSEAGVRGYICKWNIGELQQKVKQYLDMPLSSNE
jgi:CheY-like chemotaxis protein